MWQIKSKIETKSNYAVVSRNTKSIASTLKYLRQFLHEWLSDMH